MSIEALTVVLHHSKAKLSSKLVLIGIANHYHSDDDRGAWPSQETLARYANISDRGVRKAIDQLVAIGELRVETHGGPSKDNYKPNRYFITLECPDDCDKTMNHRPKQPEQSDIATGTFEQGNRNFLTEQPEPGFLRTVIEPVEKPLKNRGRQKPANADEYQPSSEFMEKLATDFPGVRLDTELEKFRDHHMAAGSKWSDWDRAFRKWVRQASDWSPEARAARVRAEEEAKFEQWKRENGEY